MNFVALVLTRGNSKSGLGRECFSYFSIVGGEVMRYICIKFVELMSQKNALFVTLKMLSQIMQEFVRNLTQICLINVENLLS